MSRLNVTSRELQAAFHITCFTHHVSRFMCQVSRFTFFAFALFLCVFFLPPILIRAQGSAEFTEVWFDDAIDNTQSVAWGDMDGDGDLDLAVGNIGQVNRLYRNEGGGTFVELVGALGPTTDSTHSVAWGDMDGDGDLDLAVGNYRQVNRLYRNEGGGSFVELVGALGSSIDDTATVAWGDYDGDGNLDLVVGNTGRVNRLYHNEGKGTFVELTGILGPFSDATQSVVWGDYNSDGSLDLAVGNFGQVNRLYRNDGPSTGVGWTFTDVTTDTLGLTIDYTYSMAWGDMDGDGDLDLAVGNYAGMNCLYRNEGGAVFSKLVTSLDLTASYASSVAWGDMDGDGDLDLAVGNMERYVDLRDVPVENRLYRNDGPSGSSGWTFTDVTTDTLGLTADDTRSVAWGDYDGDGNLELVVGNFGVNRMYHNIGGGTFIELIGTLGPATDPTYSLAWGDYDGDGDPDLVVGNYGQVNRLYRNDSPSTIAGGTFTDVTTDTLGLTAEDTSSVAWGDIDGDGDLDLAVGNYGSNRLYRNDGQSISSGWNFADVTTYTLGLTANNTSSVAWGDYDGDGDLDLAIGNYGEVNRLYRNDGSLIFIDVTTDTLGLVAYRTSSVAWGDMDGDGDLDLAIGNYGQVNQLYRNEGGAFIELVGALGTVIDLTYSVAWGGYGRRRRPRPGSW